MYVDDIIMVTRKANVEFDVSTATTVCCSLLGDNAVEHKKTEVGRNIVAIGYEFDLNKSLVTLSPRNRQSRLGGTYSQSHSQRYRNRLS